MTELTEFKKTDKNFIMVIPNNERFNISLVYNRHFFELFDFHDFHVNSFGENIPIITNNTNKSSTSSGVLQGSRDLDESDDDLQIATKILGKEKIPDGYSQLPLPIKQKGGSILDTVENSLTDTYHKYSKYLSLSSEKETLKEELVDPSIRNKEIRITFPDSSFHVTPLTDMITNGDDHSIFTFSTNVDYHEIEQIAKDLIFQLQYFENEGIIFQDLSTSSIFKINDRYLILDSKNMVMLNDKKQKSQMYKSIYKMFIVLMGKTRNDSIYIVPYTKLYYMLHRLETEDCFAWI